MQAIHRIDVGGPRRKRSLGRSRLFYALLFVMGLSGACPSWALTYHSLPPFPTGIVRYAQPTLRWKVWTSERFRVLSARMMLNGRPVQAHYEASERAAVYTPEQPLPPGDYSIHCAVLLDAGPPIERDWEFTVAKSAVTALPEPNREALIALSATNAYRRRMGLPELRLHNALCASAEAHSRYLDANEEYGHYEQPGHDDYTGRDLLERDAAFGYFGGGYENVSYGSSSSREAVQRLFDAPYHRIPFMQPGTPDFGMGQAGKQATLEFGLSETEGSVVYPADGQTNVPLAWYGNEDPDPLRLHGARGRVGYIITFAYFAPESPSISVRQASLEDVAGEEVPCYINTPENDSHLPNGVFLIPERPLHPNTLYTARVQVTTGEGREISRVWTFTTQPAPSSPPAKKRRKS